MKLLNVPSVAPVELGPNGSNCFAMVKVMTYGEIRPVGGGNWASVLPQALAEVQATNAISACNRRGVWPQDVLTFTALDMSDQAVWKSFINEATGTVISRWVIPMRYFRENQEALRERMRALAAVVPAD